MAGQLSGWRQDRLAEAGRDGLARVGGYLRGTAILAATDALSDFVFLTLLGIPLAAPLSVLVFFGGFIPYVGGLITTTIVVLVTYSYGGLGDVVILLVLITVMNVIQGNFLAPVIYGKTVDLHPAIVLVAMPAGGAIAGIIGLFLAIPVVAFIAAITGALVDVLGERSARAPTGSDIVPPWLDRIGQVSWRLLAAFALGAILVAVTLTLWVVVMGVLLGIILAATLVPIVDRLRTRGWGRSRAAIAVTGLVALAVVVVMAGAIVAVAGEVVAAAKAAVAGASTAETTTGLAGGSLAWLAQVAVKLGGETAGAFVAFASAISTIAVVLILAGLLTFYFLKDGDRGWQRVLDRSSGWRRELVDEAGRRAVGILGGYMRGTGAVALFDAVTLFIILTVLGIPFALPLSVILFFGGFIPYVGALIASFLAVMVTIQYGGTRDVAILLVYTGVLNIVQGNILAPLILGHAVRLHPAVILCAIPAGGAIAGIPGMFLAVPFLGVLAAIREPIGDALGEPADGTAADRPAQVTVGRASDERSVSPQVPPPEPASGEASIG